MARPKKIDAKVEKRIQELHREGLGVTAIGRRLQAEGLPGSPASAHRILGKLAAKANQKAERAAMLKKHPPPAPPAHEDEVGGAVQDLADAEAAHVRLSRRAQRLADKIDHELGLPEPNWPLVRYLSTAERDVVEALVRAKLPKERQPEDDVAYVEAARVLVSDLRARVEAARRGA